LDRLQWRAIRQNRSVVRYEGTIEDITERKLLQGQLVQAQKLESIGDVLDRPS